MISCLLIRIVVYFQFYKDTTCFGAHAATLVYGGVSLARNIAGSVGRFSRVAFETDLIATEQRAFSGFGKVMTNYL